MKRANSISIAVPASMVSEIAHIREKTIVLGQLGRAAGIYRVDEIIIYRDDPDESLLMKYVLGYLETPQYLRKHLFEHRVIALLDPTQCQRLTPGLEYVEVAGVFHLIDLVCARRSATDFAEYDFAVRLAIPLHVREAGAEFQGLYDVVAHLHAAGEKFVVDIPERDDLRTDPFIAARN